MKTPIFSLIFFLLFAPWAPAGVYLTQAQALGIYFPSPQIVERNTLFLSEEEVSGVKKRAEAPFEENVISYYKGLKDGAATGFAFFDTHTIRNMNETLMVVISPEGRILGVEILSFLEPEDYKPTKRWQEQFEGKNLDDNLMVKRGIRNITGATLTAQAISASARRALALFEFVKTASNPEDSKKGIVPAKAGTR